MRLINTDTLVIEEFGFGEIPNYAILSHRWYKYELNLQDVQSRIWEKQDFTNENKIKAFEKINRCCVRAKSDAFKYAWIDSCCIDKTSSAELSEAINSMYLWYYKAGRCYAYLSDVQSIDNFKESEWFKRGWTLQELLAPAEVYFLDKDWNDLGTKKSLQEAVSNQTRIPVNILSGASLEMATVAQRMSWASQRKTTRIEDRAYCLMGIFGINMPLLYGEGERAFIRLQEEIMRISNDHSIFCWKSRDARGGLLATSPDAFSDSNNIIHYTPFGDSSGPLTVSSKGIHLKLRFIGLSHGGHGLAILHCAEREQATKPLAIYVKDTALTMELFERFRSECFERIGFSSFQRWQYPIRQMCIRMGRMAPMGRAESSGNQHGTTGGFYDHNLYLESLRSLDTGGLFRAAQAGERDTVWLWLTRGNIKADLADNQGRTALWHAVMGHHEALVKTLLARSDVNADFQDKEGRTPLSWAAQHGHEAIVKLLLEKEVDIEARYANQTPLLWAAANKHETVIQMLLDNGAEIEAKDNNGQTSLSLTAADGHEALGRLLLEEGAYDETKDEDKWTPLLHAAMNGHEGIVRLLLERGTAIEARDSSEQTPLSKAAEKGHEAIAKLLLENGADMEARDGNKCTPLLQATMKGHEAIVRLLLEKGADIEATDYYMATPLFHAAHRKREAVVKLLLENGADTEAKNNDGQTPLFVAGMKNHGGIVKLLLENGADIEAKDKEGQTVRSWAMRTRAYHIVQLLDGKY